MGTLALSLAPDCLGFVFFDGERRLQIARLHEFKSVDVFETTSGLAAPVLELAKPWDRIKIRWTLGRSYEAGLFIGTLLAKKLDVVDYPVEARAAFTREDVKQVFADVEWMNATVPEAERKQVVFWDAVDLGVKAVGRRPTEEFRAKIREELRAEFSALNQTKVEES